MHTATVMYKGSKVNPNKLATTFTYQVTSFLPEMPQMCTMCLPYMRRTEWWPSCESAAWSCRPSPLGCCSLVGRPSHRHTHSCLPAPSALSHPVQSNDPPYCRTGIRRILEIPLEHQPLRWKRQQQWLTRTLLSPLYSRVTTAVTA